MIFIWCLDRLCRGGCHDKKSKFNRILRGAVRGLSIFWGMKKLYISVIWTYFNGGFNFLLFWSFYEAFWRFLVMAGGLKFFDITREILLKWLMNHEFVCFFGGCFKNSYPPRSPPSNATTSSPWIPLESYMYAYSRALFIGGIGDVGGLKFFRWHLRFFVKLAYESRICMLFWGLYYEFIPPSLTPFKRYYFISLNTLRVIYICSQKGIIYWWYWWC